MQLSDELIEMFHQFIYHVAVEVGTDDFGESPEALKLYQDVANHMSSLYIYKNELPDWVGIHMHERAPKFGFELEEK